MINLYWRTESQTRSLIPKPFSSEMEFEKYVFENQDLLGDVYLIHRQIRTGSKQGIPDMLGVDKDARVCIIEMKNEEASEDVLPQVLQYAIWAETQPDSIKAIWLESENKPEDIELDWDNLEIRILVIAPSFRDTVPRMTGKIGYPIDLVQVQRFSFEDDEFILVDVLDETPQPKISTTKVMKDWDWVFYEQEHGKKATEQFRTTVESLESLVNKLGLDLQYNLNKHYTGFKLGNKVVFSVGWGGTHAWKIEMKIPEELAEGFKGKFWEVQRFDDRWGNAIFRPLNPENANVSELEPMLLAAYKNISGAG